MGTIGSSEIDDASVSQIGVVGTTRAALPAPPPVRPAPTYSALPSHVPALDALRGVAILLVLARHSSATNGPSTAVGGAVLEVMRGGWIGVDLFFALSGFLITGILIETKGTPDFLRNFYARRTLRIFPLYFAFLAALFLIGPLTPLASNPEFRVVQSNQGWLWSYTTNILVSWQGARAVPLHLGHLWSLALEEQFYLVWPFVVLVIPLRAIPKACLTLSGAAILLRLAMIVRTGWGLDAAYMLMPARLDALLLGGLLAWLIRSPAGRLQVRRLQLPLGLAAIGLLAGLFIWHRGMERNDPYMQLAGYTALSVLSVVLIASALPGSGSGWYQRFLSTRWLQSLGKYSYAVYVFQYPIILVLERALRPVLRGRGDDSTLMLSLIILVSATLLSYGAARASWAVIEGPALSLKRYFPRRTAA